MNHSHAITTPSASNQTTRLGRPAVGRQAIRALGALALSGGLALAALPASATLANPGFETSTLVPYTTLLSGPIVTGVWGQENSAIVGAVGPIMPVGAQMLQMGDAGGATTQAGQFIAVTPNTTLTFGASFNANLPAAQANLGVTFFAGNSYSSLIPPSSTTQLMGAGLTLDNAPGTWQPLTVTGTVPVGAQYALAQVWYSNASLAGSGALGMGYVDQTFTAAVPEPSTYGLLAMGLALLGFKLRRQPTLDRD